MLLDWKSFRRWVVGFGILYVILPASCWGVSVAVILSRQAGPYQETLQGAQMVPGLKITLFSLNGKLEAGKDILDQIAAGNYQSILAIGSEAVAVLQANPPALPVVYTMVLEPVTIPKAKVVGIPIKIGVAEQIKMIRKAFPESKHIGVVYNPANSRSDVDQARDAAGQNGFSIQPIAVDGPDEIPNALKKLNRQTIDVLWMTMDKTTAQPAAVKLLIEHAMSESLPLIGLSVFHVQAGALAAFSVDFKDLGKQAGEWVQQVGEKGGQSRIESPRKIIIFVNERMQKQLRADSLKGLSETQIVK